MSREAPEDVAQRPHPEIRGSAKSGRRAPPVVRRLRGKAPEDPEWQKLAGGAAPAETAPAEALLIAATEAWLRGGPGLRQLAMAAVLIPARPELEAVWTELREAFLNSLSRSLPVAVKANTGLILRIVAMADALRAGGRARRILDLATAILPDEAALGWELMLRQAMAKPPEDIRPLLKRLIQRSTVPAELPPRRLLALCRALSAMPEPERLEILSAMTRGYNWTQHRRHIIHTLSRQIPVETTGLRRPLIGPLTGELHVSAPGDAGVTMLVFCGLGNSPAAPVPQFDMYLARRGIRAIYLADRQGRSYINGLKSLGDDRDSMFQHLRRLLDDCPGDRVITAGFSMSAIAATATALVLKGEAVITFGGYTSGASGFLEAIGDIRNPGYAEEAERLGGPDVDLRAWFATHEHRPVIHMHYAERMVLDRAHAEAIAGNEGVALFAHAGHTEHRLSAEMMVRGSFGPALDQIIAALPAERRRP